MALYRAALRPLLFRLSADRSHALAHAALRCGFPWRRFPVPRVETRFAGVTLPNPVGLAAGFDKDGELVEALSCLGFGFVTVGSIMPQARTGNPFPRLVRYPETRSMADSMGLPSKGREYAVACLKRISHRPVPLFANVGGFTAAEIADSFLALEPYVDGVEMNLLCPNLPPGETFDEIRLLRETLARLQGRTKPAIVRVPNPTARSEERLAELIEACVEGGVAGIKVGGGRPVKEPRLGTGQGTLHGRAIFEAALENVARAARLARGRLDIKGNGGIFTAADVRAMQQAGACCIDLYSAFIYEGWSVASAITRTLVRGQAPNPI